MVDVQQANVEAARRALETAQGFHFVGIGGVGMSALARYLLHIGKQVSGTDRSPGRRLDELASHGARVRVGHNPEAIPPGACVVYTTAIPRDNAELVAARELGLPVVHRAELLAAIVNQRESVAITGTHGKTTTTAMLAHILAAAGLRPLAFVGGEVNGWPDGNLLLGDGPAVYEACESDGTLLLYKPTAAILTSLEPDHLDQHKTFENLRAKVRQFAARVPPEGHLLYWAECEALAGVVDSGPAKKVSYGRGAAAQWRAENVRIMGEELLVFDLCWLGGRTKVKLRAVGRHNALNATAAVAAAHEIWGVDVQTAAEALAAYPGVARRFQFVGWVGSSRIVHDYAHHPTEIGVVIQAAREHLGGKVLVVFQPHLFSRTRDLMDGFATCFNDADEVIILPIYAAREEPLPGITSEVLYQRVRQARGERETRIAETFDEVAERARLYHRAGWVVLVLGAGDVEKLAYLMAEA
ncbi:MAG: UDP-N-acetylmuramate--L-alanine ligase [Armatimonadetes bacterium]|nr:UDP-N-acetylmuramate--L-alanine ligase [Armatimonadota bacterium]